MKGEWVQFTHRNFEIKIYCSTEWKLRVGNCRIRFWESEHPKTKSVQCGEIRYCLKGESKGRKEKRKRNRITISLFSFNLLYIGIPKPSPNYKIHRCMLRTVDPPKLIHLFRFKLLIRAISNYLTSAICFC